MKSSVGVLCDKVTVREGLLHILGGGVRVLGRPQLPAPLDVDLALMLEPENIEEMSGTHELIISLLTDNGDPVMVGGFTYDLAAPEECPDPLPGFPFAIPLGDVQIPVHGGYVLKVDVDGTTIITLRFTVEKQLAPGVTGSFGAEI